MRRVTDERAILAHLDREEYSWLDFADFGTNIVVTYSFNAKYGANGVGIDGERGSAFTQQQEKNFRKAADAFSDKSGIIFVETNGPAMVNVYNSPSLPSSTLGLAHLPYYSEQHKMTTTLLMNTGGTMNPGTEGFYVLMHELGHTMGLDHPFDGPFQLTAAADKPSNTVMAYTSRRLAEQTTELGRLDKKALVSMFGTSKEADALDVRRNGDKIEIKGDSGANKVMGTTMENVIHGRGGRDTLMARSADDRIFGGVGDDEISGGFGANRLFGGDGDDTIYSDGRDRAFGGDGRDLFYGGDVETATVEGDAGRDKFIGQTNDFVAFGNGGKDDFQGGRGRDSFYGGTGDDTLKGGLGHDALFGGAGNDVLTGSDGRDTLDGGAGRDVLRGGNHNDTVFGGRNADKIYGDGALDNLFGGGAADLIFGGEAKDSIFGGGGTDTLNGGQGRDDIKGEGGDDVIYGGDDIDDLFGGKGTDRLYGGAGADMLTGGSGNDVMNGQGGPDTFVFNEGDGDDRIVGFSRNQDTLLLSEDLVSIFAPDDDIAGYMGTVVNGNLVLTFENAGSVTLLGVTSTNNIQIETFSIFDTF